MMGHGDFCALVVVRGTAAIFAKAGCTHLQIINKPTFNISPDDLENIPSEARSMGNRFITKFGRKVAESLLETKLELFLTKYENIFTSAFFLLVVNKYSYDTIFRLMSVENEEPKLKMALVESGEPKM
jgi:hypothetical protein